MASACSPAAAPDEVELALLEKLRADESAAFERDPRSARALLAVGRRRRRRHGRPAETAALAVVASTMMNFDGSVFKR